MKIKKEHLNGIDIRVGDKVRFVKREEDGERWSELDGLEIGKEYVVKIITPYSIVINKYRVSRKCFVIV